MSAPHEYRCTACGSYSISAIPVSCHWDTEERRWELTSVEHDEFQCQECESTDIEELPIVWDAMENAVASLENVLLHYGHLMPPADRKGREETLTELRKATIAVTGVVKSPEVWSKL